MKHTVKSGAAIAAAALTMAVGLATFSAAPSYAEGNNVHCFGVNSCKGQSDCKSITNSCKGLNACKGHGFMTMSADDCRAKGGMADTPNG